MPLSVLTDLKKLARLVAILTLALGLTVLTLGLTGRHALAAAPAISIAPTSGPWGSSVTVTGSNFAANETGIVVTYDPGTGPAVVASGIAADGAGVWTSTFVVPYSPPGTHVVSAHGNATPDVTASFSVPGVTFSLSTTGGLVGMYVTASGSGFGAREGGIVVTYDGAVVVAGISANAQGSWSAAFAVPASASGAHNVGAYGSGTPAASVPVVSFTVSPSIAVSRSNASPGSSVTVTGSGFAANESGIVVAYDGAVVSSGILASSLGAWGAAFTVPASAAGPHAVTAYGSVTPASSMQAATLTVSPGIVLGKASGASGSSLTVNGSGYAANEGGITVTFDGAPVASGISANALGAWTASITVPPSPSGSHTISAYGSVTQAGSVNGAGFSVTASLTLGRLSGTAGASVTVSGSGFGANEGGITVTFDGAPVASGISANGLGAWSASFTVPTSTAGSHSVSAYGSVTQAGSVGGVSFSVGAGLTLGRTSGSIGSSLTVSGAGFAANEGGIAVAYDGVTVASGISANAQGSWTATFAVPPSASGTHTITASGSVTQASSVTAATFSVSGGLTLGKPSGVPGNSLTVDGAGFAANEGGITVTYDGAMVSSGITANGQGAWSTTFAVPPSASGLHNIAAYGSTTPAASIPGATFTVNPGIVIGRGAGGPGGSLTVNGAGFAANEGGIAVSYDGAIVVSGISANGQGAWSAVFTVPPSSSGPHSITAYGSITQASSVAPATFSVAGGLTLGKTSGAAGSSVTVSGSGFASNEGGITVAYDGVTVASGISANGQGAWSATFIVPPSVSGAHNVTASGSTTPSANVPGVTYTVIPNIALDRSSGAPGSSLNVSGSGFGANEGSVSITYDGAVVSSGILANAQGSWSASFAVPQSASGAHSVDASGSITQASSVPDVTFTVRPNIAVSKPAGTPGSSLTVNGSGFAASQGGIVVTYDGAVVATGISANGEGSWSATFTVPASASGTHSVTAYGSTTPAASIPVATFIVNPGISVGLDTGAPGASLTVSGAGFAASESGIVVTFDGVPAVSRINANPQGGWAASATVPPSVSGPHSIAASGSITQAANVPQVSFVTTPAISLGAASGHVGMKVAISGSGFAGNSEVKVTYDGAALAGDSITTDASGSFTDTVSIPSSKAGNHVLAAQDGRNDVAETPFAMDSTPPPLPALLSPKNSGRVGFVGDASPTFQWTAVSDPSGVTYHLQVSATADFSHPVLDKVGLSDTSYAVAGGEALPRGRYYWRVQAVDGASNQSAWTQPYVLNSGLMPLWAFVLILVIVIAALLAGIYALLVLRARRREAAAPLAVPGYWREVGAEEVARPRGLPWRRSLPTPSRGPRALSSEQQARIKIIGEFAQSLPLVEPGYNTEWLVGLMEASLGETVSAQAYEQWLQGQLVAPYQPEWMSHPLYQELRSLLQGQPVLRRLDDFLDGTNRCSSECLALLQEVYRDTVESSPDVLSKGGFAFISAVYSDAIDWHRGKSLREPSVKDYAVKVMPGADGAKGEVWLYGAEGTSFAGPLVKALDEKDAEKFRSLHLKLRRDHRQSEKAKQLVGMIAQLQVQRASLLNALSQLAG